VVVDRLPKTRSGKILRGTIQAIAEGREWRMPATIEDPSAIQVVTEALERVGNSAAQGGGEAA
jgi:propionyl-CoA synthetase